MPYLSLGDKFVGRIGALWDLYDSLFRDATTVVQGTGVVAGTGGLGKTQLGDVWEFLSFYQSNPETIAAQGAKGERLEAANMFLHFDWKLPDNTGILSLDVRHGARVPDQRQVLVLELTCRGRIVPLESDLRGRFQVGHDAIVNTFAKLTTEHGHTIWRRLSEQRNRECRGKRGKPVRCSWHAVADAAVLLRRMRLYSRGTRPRTRDAARR